MLQPQNPPTQNNNPAKEPLAGTGTPPPSSRPTCLANATIALLPPPLQPLFKGESRQLIGKPPASSTSALTNRWRRQAGAFQMRPFHRRTKRKTESASPAPPGAGSGWGNPRKPASRKPTRGKTRPTRFPRVSRLRNRDPEPAGSSLQTLAGWRESAAAAAACESGARPSVRPALLIRSWENRCVCSGSGRLAPGPSARPAFWSSSASLLSSGGESLGPAALGSGVRVCQAG